MRNLIETGIFLIIPKITRTDQDFTTTFCTVIIVERILLRLHSKKGVSQKHFCDNFALLFCVAAQECDPVIF